jgi:site-specific DNA recombinase
VLNVLGSVSQWEREAIGERTSAAMRHKAAQGEFVGGTPPYGFQVLDGRLDPVQSEQAVIARARELRASGLSLRRVGITLAASGLRSRTGKPFLPAQLARMLESVRAAAGDHPEPSEAPPGTL